MKINQLMKNRNTTKTLVFGLSVAASIATFFMVAQIGLYLSGAGILALAMAAWSAVFVFNYLPVHLLARIRLEIMHPPPKTYSIRAIDALAEIKELLTREYFVGKTWMSRSEDKEKKELVFVCRYQEPDVNEKGQTLVDLELQLIVAVLQLKTKVAVQLDYRLNDLRPSILANEIAEQTTISIESKLSSMEKRQ